jgi:hypothetical protein
MTLKHAVGPLRFTREGLLKDLMEEKLKKEKWQPPSEES